MPSGYPKSGINKGQFVKGHKTWNKGTKGLCKPNSGSFKKGHKLGRRFKKGQTSPRKGKKYPEYSGPSHPLWKGGITKTSQGYILQSINGKQVLQHRLIMQKHLERKLTFNEIVHHINGNKADNRIENLELLTRSEHTRLYGHYSSHTQNTL